VLTHTKHLKGSVLLYFLLIIHKL